MTKEDYMKLPKERLAEILAQKDLEDEYARGIYRGWAPTVPTTIPQEPVVGGVNSPHSIKDCLGLRPLYD